MNGSPIQYDFRAGAKAIRYSVNMALSDCQKEGRTTLTAVMLRNEVRTGLILMLGRYHAFEVQFHLIVVFNHFLKLVSKIIGISLGYIYTITNSFLC